MRRLGNCRPFASSFLKRQKTVRQHRKLRLQPVYFLPLGGKLLGKLVDGLRLMGNNLFQIHDTVITHRFSITFTQTGMSVFISPAIVRP